MRNYYEREASARYNPSDPDFLKNPYPIYERLRQSGIVYHEHQVNRWYVMGANAADAVLRNKDRYSHDLRTASPGTASHTLLQRIGEENLSMLFLDAPQHTRLRRLVSRAFSAYSIEAFRLRVHIIANELLDQISNKDKFDLVEEFAAPMSTQVIAEMLGVNPTDWPQFKRWSDADVKLFDPFISNEERRKALAAQEELSDYFKNAVAERKKVPKNDLISSLIHTTEVSDRLTDNEILIMSQLLLRAGNVSTTDLIGNCMLALLENPTQLKMLQTHPSLIKSTVEEVLRYDTPVLEAGRISLRDVEIDRITIPKGETIMVALGAANRDPRTTQDVNSFNIDRERIRHYSFGAGPHFCLGAPLARMEAQVSIGTLLQRFQGIQLGEVIQRRLLPSFRGLTSLEVRVTSVGSNFI